MSELADVLDLLSEEDKLKFLAAAAQRLQKHQRNLAFDPTKPDSRPNEAQQQIITDYFFNNEVKNLYVLGGNQCLAKDTLVATPKGPIAIQYIKVGDTVYSEEGKEIKVKEVFYNGKKKVGNLVSRGFTWATATNNHVWLKSKFSKKDGSFISDFEATSDTDDAETATKRVFVSPPIGKTTPDYPYVLGAMLGDGCCREGKRLSISSGNDLIPSKIAKEMNTSWKRNSLHNYTYIIETDNRPSYYAEWCHDRYAHEKIVDINILKTWTRDSIIKFIAGVFDTDGSLYSNSKAGTLVWSIGMQAKSVIDAISWAMLALWQIPATSHIDNRAKYKNGPIYTIMAKNPHDIKRMMEELEPHIVSDQKKWREEYNELGRRTRPGYTKLSFIETTDEVETYDIHVDSPRNLYLLANGLVTHNSGKTTTMLRIFSWLLEESLPGWKRPKHWEGDNLTFLVLSRTGKQISESLIPRLQAMLTPGEYKIVTVGNIPQAIHMSNGNRMILQSYENENVARERVQSYTIHGVGVDEMPRTYALLEELQRRVQAKKGKLITAFTPKVVSQEIRKVIDVSDGKLSKKYSLLMMSNPIYTDEDKQRILAELSTASESWRNTVLTGAWLAGDDSVYNITQGMIRAPEGYSRSWRHLEGSDPAVNSTHGMVILAEDPATGFWYVVEEHEISGLSDPTMYPLRVKELTQYLNMNRRVYDAACPWYAQLAHKVGLTYITNWNKNSTDRRLEMLKNTQVLLGSKVFIAPWCTKLIDELESMQWSATVEGKVVGSSKYHLGDAFRYACDLLPQFEGPTQNPLGWEAQLREDNDNRKKVAAMAKSQSKVSRGRMNYKPGWGRRGR